MGVNEMRTQLETIKQCADNLISALTSLSDNTHMPVEVKTAAAPLPELINAVDVMRHYTGRSTNDLYVGVKSGKYPKPICGEKKKKRLWLREDWENWIKRTKTDNAG